MILLESLFKNSHKSSRPLYHFCQHYPPQEEKPVNVNNNKIIWDHLIVRVSLMIYHIHNNGFSSKGFKPSREALRPFICSTTRNWYMLDVRFPLCPLCQSTWHDFMKGKKISSFWCPQLVGLSKGKWFLVMQSIFLHFFVVKIYSKTTINQKLLKRGRQCSISAQFY